MENEHKYPKIVTQRVNDVIITLREDGFFDDYNITEKYAHKLLSDEILEKYVADPSLDLDFFWEEEEFTSILSKIIVGSVLNELKDVGYLDSYEDDSTDEVFFLTDHGKEVIKNK